MGGDLPNTTSRHPVTGRRCRARAPRPMASAVATPLRKQFSTIAGIDSMTFDERARQSPRSTDPVPSRATSTRRPRTCRPPSRAAQPQMPPGHPTRLPTRRPSADQPIPLPGASSRRPCRSTWVDEYAHTNLSHASRRSGRGPGGDLSLSEVRGGRSSIRSAMATHRDRHRRGAEGLADSNVNCPRPPLGAEPGLQRAGHWPAHHAAAYRPLIVAYRRLSGSARAARPVLTGCKRHGRSGYNDERAVVLAIQKEAAGDQHHSMWSTSITASCRVPGPAPASDDLNILYDRRSPSARRSTTCSSPCCSRSRWWCWHLPLPAQRVGDPHPEPGPAHVDRGHVHGDVRARLTLSTTSPLWPSPSRWASSWTTRS